MRVTSEQARGDERGFVVTLDDITDLVSAQRTSAWADVARRIAHEIKNPLTPIQLSAERIRRKYGKVITTDREVFDQCTDTIVRQVDDIKRMVDEFSSFARMPKPTIGAGGSRRDRAPDRVHDADRRIPTSHFADRAAGSPGRRAVRPPAPVAGRHEHREERHRGDRGGAGGRARAGRRSTVRARRRATGFAGDRRHRQRQGLSRRGAPAAARALHDDPRRRHGPRPRHRQQDPRGAWRRHRTRSTIRMGGEGASACGFPTAARGAPHEPDAARAARSIADGECVHERRHPDRRRRSRHPRPRRRHPRGRGPPHPHGRRSSDEALAAIEARRPHLVFLDIWLQGSRLDGLQVLDLDQGRAPGPAGRDDLRPRQHRDGRLGDQGRRLRLHREAVQGRPPGAGRRAGAGGLAPEARGPRPARPARRRRAASSAGRSPSTSCARRSSASRRPMRAS